MTNGIWLLFYDIAAADRDHYVDWFHRCHISEKLARPGYRWAAHFEAPPHPATVIFIGILECLAVIRPEYFWIQARPS